MRIEYEFESKKKLIHHLNAALGIFAEKRKILKKVTKRPKTLTQICVINYLLCLIDFIIVYNLFEFKYDDLATLLALVIVFTFIVTTFSLFTYFINILKHNDLKGEIRFSEEGIEELSESGKVVKQPWKNIRFIYIDTNTNTIYILAKRIIFFYSFSENNQKVINEAIEKYQLNIEIIENESIKINKFKKNFWNWGIYLIIFCVTFSFTIGYDVHNTNILTKEIEKIVLSHKVDFNTYSHGNFAIVEKYAKKYYYEFYKNLDKYEENSALNIFNSITYDLLENNPKELYTIYYSLYNKKIIADNTLEKLIKMFDEEYALSRIAEEKLSEYYEELYLNCIFTSNDEIYINDLVLEKESNTIKMDSLEQIIILLINNYQDWYIKNDNLYFYTEELLDEYNRLYAIITEEKENNGIKI